MVYDNMISPRSRLLWDISLSNSIEMALLNKYLKYKDDGTEKKYPKMVFVKYSIDEYEIFFSWSENIGNTRLDDFEFGLLNNSTDNKEYVIGRETKYYILIIKHSLEIVRGYPIFSYFVLVLDKHTTVASTFVEIKGKNLLPVKKEGVRLLLEHNPNAEAEDVAIIHYKQDKLNGLFWQKDSNTFLDGLFNLHKQNKVKINLETVIQDIESEKAEEDTYYREGAIRFFYGKRYERSPINRQRAIELHGTTCIVCGFSFEELYGEHGKDFIEVHHVKPLSVVEGEVEINPEEDLVPLCSNCHRMIHRNHEAVLSVQELKVMISKLKEKRK